MSSLKAVTDSKQTGADAEPRQSRQALPADSLTPREMVVLGLVIDGLTSKEAGDLLGVSRRTVEFHRANIMQKFAARNVADLVRLVRSK